MATFNWFLCIVGLVSYNILSLSIHFFITKVIWSNLWRYSNKVGGPLSIYIYVANLKNIQYSEYSAYYILQFVWFLTGVTNWYCHNIPWTLSMECYRNVPSLIDTNFDVMQAIALINMASIFIRSTLRFRPRIVWAFTLVTSNFHLKAFLLHFLLLVQVVLESLHWSTISVPPETKYEERNFVCFAI